MEGTKLLGHAAHISRSALIVGLVAAGTAGFAYPAFAQNASVPSSPAQSASAAPATAQAEGQTDIVVTASRQSLGSQKVPIALTAVGAKQLSDQGITSPTQLSQLSPSLFVLGSVSEGSPRFTLRGLTFSDTQANGSPAVATYIDDVYQSFQFGVTAQVFDLQRVEILRGPQGTTFGRNTTGGAIAYFNQTPTNEVEGYVSARLAGGDQPQRFIQAVANVPLVDDRLALRISVGAESKSGYVRDETSGRKRGGGDSQTGRVQLRYTPSADTTVNLTVFAMRRDGDASVTYGQLLPAPVTVGRTALTPGKSFDNFENYGATLRIEQGLGSDVSLTSISHYRRTKFETGYDLDGLPVDSLYYQDKATATQYGQEIRIASDPDRRLSGILGGYFEHDRVFDELNYASLTGGIGSDFNNYIPSTSKTTAFAAFANLTFKVTDTLSLIGGIRKSSERKANRGTAQYYLNYDYDWTQRNIITSGIAPVVPNQAIAYNLRQKATPWTWDGTVNFTPGRDLLVYARIAKGFRSGGFNYSPLIADPSSLPITDLVPFAGETVRSYEAGIKAGLFNNRLRVNASGFHYDYSDQQVTEYINVQTVTRNAGRSKVDGGELELTGTPVRNLDLRGSVSYTNARYTRYTIAAIGADYAGNRLVQAPKWNLNGSINYTLPLTGPYDITSNASVSYRSKIYFDSVNSQTLSAGGMAMVNLRVGIQPRDGEGLSVTAFVNNLTDQRPLASGFVFIPDAYYVKYFNPGRFFGVDVSYHW